MNVTLQLPEDDARFLLSQLGRLEQTVESELVHTDAPQMQHELAADLRRVQAVRAQLASAIEVGPAR